MARDHLDELRSANPVPELLPGLPLEVIRRRLDHEPPVDHRPGRRGRSAGPGRLAGAGIPLVATAVTIAVAALVIGALHPGGHAPESGGPGPTPTGLLPVHPSARQRTELAYINRAFVATIRTDRACGGAGPRMRDGTPYTGSDASPPRQLLSALAVLRGRAGGGEKLPSRMPSESGQAVPDRTLSLLSAKEIYVRYIRRARRGSGLSYYVVPVATTAVAPPIPARCYGEQLSALERQLPHVPRSLRVGTLALEARFLNQMRHDRRPQAGVCLVSVGPGGGSGCSYTVSDIEQGRAIESAGGPDEVAVTWGLVPDGVATVTIAYPGHGRDGRAVTATGKVTNNVFIIPNHGRWLTNATITWRSVMGAVIKTVSP